MANTSRRSQELPVSATRKLTPYALKAKEEGVKVYHLNIGDPDVKTPEVLIDVLHKWEINPIRYANSVGEKVFLDAMVEYYSRLGYKIESKDLIATIGGTEALSFILFSICDQGDEVIVFEPFYSAYSTIASMLNIKLIPIETDISNGFHLPKRAEIEKVITSKTKAILYCSPNNPTGAAFSHDEIGMLVDIAKDKNLYLVADEVYREYIFSGVDHVSLFEFFSVIPDQAIIADSLSKRYSLCGARLGIITTLNKDIISSCTKLAQGRLSGGFIDQIMASKMNEVTKEYTIQVQKEYEARRDLLFEELNAIPGVMTPKSEGAFYAMVKLPVENAEDFSIWLLENFRKDNETVMLAPGVGFYAEPDKGLDEVRIAYVLNQEDLRKSIEIIREGLEAYGSSKSKIQNPK